MSGGRSPGSIRILPWMLCVLIGVLAGLGGYTFYYARGFSYLSNDPQACVNCHVMQDNYNSWVKSSHHAVAVCNDCHAPHSLTMKYVIKAVNGWNHSKAFTLQNYKEPIRITPMNSKVARESCLHCHGDLVSEIAGHRATEDLRCIQCHRSVGHMEF